jgi:membrane-bound lytic murein transglycosylase A
MSIGVNMFKKIGVVALSIAIVLSISGCRKEVEQEYEFEPLARPEYDRPLPPGMNALRKITDPSRLPDLSEAAWNVKDLKASVNRSLNYMAKGSSRLGFPVSGIEHQQVIDSLKEFAAILDRGYIGSRLEKAILEKFDVYQSVGCDNYGTVLFTGYYTPIFDGSLKRTSRFKYPLYKKPERLEKDMYGNVTTPFPSRAEIESSGMLKGTELVWLSDPFEVYVAHVQGSAKIRLPDGKLVGIGYDANNGHEYQSISQRMIDDGVISKSQLSLSAMIEHFKRHPEQVARYTAINPRFVFFRFQEGDPRGSLNEPVTALRSIATDKGIFPRASITLISTKLPQVLNSGSTVTRPYSAFMLDQDTGGAIRAPGRCDVYMGIGDQAGQLAGQVYQEGQLYYLFLKE